MSNQDNKKKVLSRRDFLKTIGAAGVATTGLSACVGAGKTGHRRQQPEKSLRIG